MWFYPLQFLASVILHQMQILPRFHQQSCCYGSGTSLQPTSRNNTIKKTNRKCLQDSKPLHPPFSLRLFESIARDNTQGQNVLAANNNGINLSDAAFSSIPLFPASYRTRGGFSVVAKPDDEEYLRSELCLDRLNDIHSWLWIVGRPMSARPLHLQRIELREIFITEQMDLHLVWAPQQIYLKPIPRFLLDVEFWEKQLCRNEKLYACAMGFLLSYVSLIEHESDYRIAIEKHLLPPEVTWPQWILLVDQLLHSPYSTFINKRFIYGELRLGRLTLIYRFTKLQMRGYLNTCPTYAAFFRDNLNSLITLFATIAIVLSAFQLGLSTQQLENNHAFSSAAYAFSVFSIAAPLLAVASVLAALVGLFYYNLIVTLIYRRQRARRDAKAQAVDNSSNSGSGSSGSSQAIAVPKEEVGA